jgi:hypothetical protein
LLDGTSYRGAGYGKILSFRDNNKVSLIPD